MRFCPLPYIILPIDGAALGGDKERVFFKEVIVYEAFYSPRPWRLYLG